MRTTVGIIGGGPAGLLLARLLHRAGIDCVVLESRDRAYVERRQRAGILEQGTVDVLRECGAGGRLDREGLPHQGIELRFEGRGHRVDFPSATGGKSVTVYAQTEIVKDLIALQLEEPGAPPLLFEAEALAIEKPDSAAPVIRFRHQGREQTLSCDYVAGCDGFHGIARRAIPADRVRAFEHTYPYSWLGVLADVAPSCEELIYARHERGFALHSMRSPHVSRLYLQVPGGTDPDDWSHDRIWDELATRFALDGDWTLERGPITSTSVTPMRSFVQEPMRHGRLFLAGDAAHIVPPTGAKGLNLAVSDVVTMARALIHHQETGSAELLDGYSRTCLRRVWQAERFSYFMTDTLHRRPDESPFEDRERIARLERIASSPTSSAELAENYVGLPLS
ncbi:4-hydroxybenzoate 3-monooxygenase [Streptomyces sp. SID8382]|uniref:4-hydroxybenzoate 3-monooxygenase n=1 Tax=Streptomyces malaysiensis TaxID=92644 RepID=UPI000C2BE206|nr:MULTISPECIES: 4-hydroxybenzoate 3-monooxygenase [unclassified Streptomyces]AUA10607.1 p-hydroxybenzoate hydroxylase [Streptomyces sp. M56]MYX61633.1 4-hydroxybenzoate 3-monooxygenase [Streptomyces sp. SID8382]